MDEEDRVGFGHICQITHYLSLIPYVGYVDTRQKYYVNRDSSKSIVWLNFAQYNVTTA